MGCHRSCSTSSTTSSSSSDGNYKRGRSKKRQFGLITETRRDRNTTKSVHPDFQRIVLHTPLSTKSRKMIKTLN